MAQEKPIKGPAKHKASMWNSGMVEGLKIGLLPAIGTVVGTAVFGAGIPIAETFLTSTSFLATAGTGLVGGALIGGLYQKTKVQEKQLEGTRINPPSFFNKGTAKGLINGLVLGGLAVAVAALTATGGVTLPLIGAVAYESFVAAVAIAGAALTGGMAYKGATDGYREMDREYILAEAKLHNLEHGQGKATGKERSTGMTSGVSGHEAHALNERLNQGAQHSFAENVESQRAEAQKQDISI